MSMNGHTAATQHEVARAKMALSAVWFFGLFLGLIQIVAYSEFPFFGKILMYDMQLGWCLLQFILFYLSPIFAVMMFFLGSRYSMRKSIGKFFIGSALLCSVISAFGFPLLAALPMMREMPGDRDIIYYYNFSSLVFSAFNTCVTFPLCAILFSVEGGR